MNNEYEGFSKEDLKRTYDILRGESNKLTLQLYHIDSKILKIKKLLES